MRYVARDFVETAEGYLFAVVASGTELASPGKGEERIPAFLRYVRDRGRWRKVETGDAHEVIAAADPDYAFQSNLRDVDLHGIPPSRVIRHYQPRLRAAEILGTPSRDPVEGKAKAVLETFSGSGIRSSHLGVTGSLLVRAHSPRSDIDLVVYDRDAFHRARETVRRSIDSGTFQALGGSWWPQAYARRASSLTFGEYVWHERRKHNKFVIGQTKVDLSMVLPSVEETRKWRKEGIAEIRAGVIDDRWGFDYPARFVIDHPEIGEVVTYTNTYTGQARTGETIHARGWIEHSGEGEIRLVVGTSREADGEFIKVIVSA